MDEQLKDAKLMEAVVGLLAQAREIPGLGPILAESRAAAEGVTDPEELDRLRALALDRILTQLSTNPGLAAEIEAAAMAAFAPTREEEPVNPLAPRPEVAPGEILIQEDGRLPRLNPFYEAALIERIQFDGDAPELRSGPMPEGAIPAVPVDTDARSLVAVGRMLKQASEEVAAEVTMLEDSAVAEKAKLLVDGDAENTTIDVIRDGGMMLSTWDVPDPEGYERGQVPALRAIEKPTGAALAALTRQERSEAVWGALSTTQGRRTALGAVRELVAYSLRNDGFEFRVSADKPRPVEGRVLYADWTMSVQGNEVQPEFNYVHMAAAVIARKLSDLFEQVPDDEMTNAVLEVFTIDAVDVRRVGWAARIRDE